MVVVIVPPPDEIVESPDCVNHGYLMCRSFLQYLLDPFPEPVYCLHQGIVIGDGFVSDEAPFSHEMDPKEVKTLCCCCDF